MYEVLIAVSKTSARKALVRQCEQSGLPLVLSDKINSKKNLTAQIKDNPCDILLIGDNWLNKSLIHSIRDQGIYEVIAVVPDTDGGMDALTAGAQDFIQYPISTRELTKAVSQAAWRIDQDISKTQALNHSVPRKVALPIKSGFRLELTEHIVYLQADGSYTKVNLSNGEQLVISKGMAWLETQLGGYPFVRVHRSYLVNLDHVREVHRSDGGYLITRCGKRIQVSKSLESIGFH